MKNGADFYVNSDGLSTVSCAGKDDEKAMDIHEKRHDHFMKLALVEAAKAGESGEVPIGAVLVGAGGQVLAAAGNRTIAQNDPCAHAEILVIREAAKKERNYRLLNTTLYVSIEPCVMCMGAILHARLKRLVFGAPDPKWGAAGSVCSLADDPRFNHRVEVTGGVCLEESKRLIQAFFRVRRGAR